MAAVRTNLSLFKGEDAAFPDTITGTDITGWAVAFTLHAKLDDAAALITKTTANGGIVLTTPASGLLTVTLLATDTANLPAGMYFYRVERTDTGADAVLSWGSFELKGK